jgi:hypothetical protein
VFEGHESPVARVEVDAGEHVIDICLGRIISIQCFFEPFGGNMAGRAIGYNERLLGRIKLRTAVPRAHGEDNARSRQHRNQ